MRRAVTQFLLLFLFIFIIMESRNFYSNIVVPVRSLVIS